MTQTRPKSLRNPCNTDAVVTPQLWQRFRMLPSECRCAVLVYPLPEFQQPAPNAHATARACRAKQDSRTPPPCLWRLAACCHRRTHGRRESCYSCSPLRHRRCGQEKFFFLYGCPPSDECSSTGAAARTTRGAKTKLCRASSVVRDTLVRVRFKAWLYRRHFSCCLQLESAVSRFLQTRIL